MNSEIYLFILNHRTCFGDCLLNCKISLQGPQICFHLVKVTISIHYLLQEGLRRAWKQLVDYCLRRSLFPGPTESPRARWIFLLAERSVIICFIISLYAYCE